MRKKIEPWEREKVTNELKELYLQTTQSIDPTNMKRNSYSKKQVKSLRKLLGQLVGYIQDLEYGVVECDLRKEDWCDIIADTLLDDDNFPYDEDGSSWH